MTATRSTLPKFKREAPETMRQAHTWDANASRYRSAGFCDRCAAQAAWGHSLGFANTQLVGACCRGKPVPDGRGERAEKWATGGED